MLLPFLFHVHKLPPTHSVILAFLVSLYHRETKPEEPKDTSHINTHHNTILVSKLGFPRAFVLVQLDILSFEIYFFKFANPLKCDLLGS